MTWIPKKLTREQMEERRRIGGQLLKAGRLPKTEIARQLGVSRMTVLRWAHRMSSGGLRQLHRRKASGRPPRLTRPQRQTVLRILKRGALAAGFPTDRWTLARIQKVIEREFGVHYHRNYLSELLQSWGWSVQQPVARARERDEELIQAWLEHDWPRIKKGAALARHHSVFR